MNDEIESMITKAADAEKSDDALKFSQAACNAANAMAQLQHIANNNNARAVELIGELSDRNDDATYRQAVKEIIEQCDG